MIRARHLPTAPTRARARAGPPGSSRGFTLLEVMVAVAILATALSAIFSSQAGMIASTNYTKRLTIATSLARCRMTELEDRLRTDGFPLDDEDETGVCCEDEDEGYESFACHWEIEQVELPSIEAIQTAAGEALSSVDAIPGAGVVGGEEEALAAAGDQASAMVGGEIAALYPLVQQILEASIRRVTVEVIWHHGKDEDTLDVVQYVTLPTQGQQAAQGIDMLDSEGPPAEGTSPTGPGGSGSSSTSSTGRGGVR